MEIKLQKVKKSDWNYILKLRNFDEFRENFYQKKTISKSKHFEYLKQQQQNPTFFNWIIFVDGKKAGYIRILDSDIGIIIDKDFQNMGIGTVALVLVENEARKLGLTKLIGKIMIHNKSSEKIFKKNNYKLLMRWYEKELNGNLFK